MTKFREHGVISECHNGIYIGEVVQSLANDYGWQYSPQFAMVKFDDCNMDTEGRTEIYDEVYTWAWDEAEEYLNTNIAEDNHYYGSHPMAGCGCWGYWGIFNIEKVH